MRVAMPINWNLNSYSLPNLARHNFRELGKIMNDTKSFVISAIRTESVAVGDFNQHFDLLHIPNLGGYRFPLIESIHCKNIILGLSGIDEVIYGKDVIAYGSPWKITKTLIDESVNNWKQFIDKIRLIHVTTKSEYEEMQKYLKIPDRKLNIIPHGVDHDFFKPSADKNKTRKEILKILNLPDKKYFLHVGERNWKRKNLSRIFEAYKLIQKHGIDYQLIIVGKQYEQITKHGKKIPGVIFLGKISNEHLLKLYQSAEGFLLPSIHEGFGMPLVEAMSCGVPCISSDRHSPPEVLNESGILVDPYNVESIANAMLSLATNPSLHDELSSKSLKHAKSFSWSKNANELFNLYNIDSSKKMENFERNYELAAYRTLVTICDLFPDEKQNFISSILSFEYSDLIKWAIDYGLNDPQTKDFLLPFEDWFYQQSEIRRTTK